MLSKKTLVAIYSRVSTIEQAEEGYSIDESDNIIETKIKRSWKEYDFDILNALENEKLLNGSYKSKSVYFTKNGENKALELYKKYFGVDYED